MRSNKKKIIKEMVEKLGLSEYMAVSTWDEWNHLLSNLWVLKSYKSWLDSSSKYSLQQLGSVNDQLLSLQKLLDDKIYMEYKAYRSVIYVNPAELLSIFDENSYKDFCTETKVDIDEYPLCSILLLDKKEYMRCKLIRDRALNILHDAA